MKNEGLLTKSTLMERECLMKKAHTKEIELNEYIDESIKISVKTLGEMLERCGIMSKQRFEHFWDISECKKGMNDTINHLREIRDTMDVNDYIDECGKVIKKALDDIIDKIKTLAK